MGGMSKTKVPAWLDSGENPLPKFRLLTSHFVFTCWRVKRVFPGLL